MPKNRIHRLRPKKKITPKCLNKKGGRAPVFPLGEGNNSPYPPGC